MPVQRKVFRIEEDARAAERGAEEGVRRRELLTEIETLRDLIGPDAGIDRSALERARAQIAEAQAYKHELGVIYAAVERTRREMVALSAEADDGRRIARAGCELAAIVGGTERATQTILQAAEKIDGAATTLAESANGHDETLAKTIRAGVVQIFEACGFQDLTGQRVDRVLETLAFVEEHVSRLIAIWNVVEQFAPVMPDKDADDGRRLLNGPKLPGDDGHATQDDIDGMFRCV